MKPYLSVIIPAYNESANLTAGALEKVGDYLKSRKYSWELVLVNDGSVDNTLQLLQEFARHNRNTTVVDNPHQGKGPAILAGALVATGEVVLFTDMDQATPISETDKLLAKISDGCDIVIGSRSGRQGAPLFRQILAYGMVVLRTLILRLPFRDTQCGFKLLRQPAAQQIFSQIQSLRAAGAISGPAVDPGFDVELLYLGRKLGYKICEVPVAWHYQETRRVRFLYDAISGLHGLLLVRWRSLIGAYKLDT